jgi:hypothetical protein
MPRRMPRSTSGGRASSRCFSLLKRALQCEGGSAAVIGPTL